jgi:hypothetical protein
MKIQTVDLMVLLDAAGALCTIFERKNGGYQHLGCKYSREQILNSFNRVNNALGSIHVEVGEKDG